MRKGGIKPAGRRLSQSVKTQMKRKRWRKTLLIDCLFRRRAKWAFLCTCVKARHKDHSDGTREEAAPTVGWPLAGLTGPQLHTAPHWAPSLASLSFTQVHTAQRRSLNTWIRIPARIQYHHSFSGIFNKVLGPLGQTKMNEALINTKTAVLFCNKDKSKSVQYIFLSFKFYLNCSKEFELYEVTKKKGVCILTSHTSAQTRTRLLW